MAVAWCELRVFFLSPSGWIVPALFLFASGLVFMQTAFRAGHPASLRGVFVFDAVFLFLLILFPLFSRFRFPPSFLL